jgi:hypothetical protein
MHFRTIDWRVKEIMEKTRKARELLTMYKIHHPNGDTDRLYGNMERREMYLRL